MVSKIEEKCAKFVGEEFTLNCGEVVKIVEYNSSENVIVSDVSGNTKKVIIDSLRRGSVAWEWNISGDGRRSKYKVGQKFVLNCGVEVEIVKMLKNSKCLVRDTDGNEATVRREHLNSGEANWYIGGRSVREILTEERNHASIQLPLKFPIGSRRMSRDFGWYSIIAHNIENNTVSVKWDNTKFEQHDVFCGYMTEGSLKDASITKNRKDLLLKPTGHYVYLAALNDKVYYIGSGKGLRYSHVNSGTSHNYKLNQHHFTSEDKLEVEIIIEGMSKEESMEVEERLICDLNPEYNYKMYAGGYRPFI